jgi:triosephosphate isomerase
VLRTVPMRIPFVVGNWKLHKTIAEGLTLVTELKNQLTVLAHQRVHVGVAPTFLSINPIAKRLEGSPILTCAQDTHWETFGPWTGEVSPPLLADAGASWIIVGHSERRQFLGDTNEVVGKKVPSVFAAGLGAIVCCGEMLADRDGGRTLQVVDAQLDAALASVTPAHATKLVVAYEPVWAIGTGRTATPSQAQEVHAHIRKRLADKLGVEAAESIRIQYGGSVKPANAEALIAEPDIDGFLVGGASLEAADFIAIVKAARPS